MPSYMKKTELMARTTAKKTQTEFKVERLMHGTDAAKKAENN